MALQSRLYSLVARRLGGSSVGTTEPPSHPTNISRKFALYSVVKPCFVYIAIQSFHNTSTTVSGIGDSLNFEWFSKKANIGTGLYASGLYASAFTEHLLSLVILLVLFYI